LWGWEITWSSTSPDQYGVPVAPFMLIIQNARKRWKMRDRNNKAMIKKADSSQISRNLTN
jgi:hypothetical protein